MCIRPHSTALESSEVDSPRPSSASAAVVVVGGQTNKQSLWPSRLNYGLTTTTKWMDKQVVPLSQSACNLAWFCGANWWCSRRRYSSLKWPLWKATTAFAFSTDSFSCSLSHWGRDHRKRPSRSICPLCCSTSHTHATCSWVNPKLGRASLLGDPFCVAVNMFAVLPMMSRPCALLAVEEGL